MGDTHALYVAGSNPVFFWSFHNGALDATGVDQTNLITGGQPGLGVAGDSNSTPTVAVTNWQGGSLPSFSSTPSESFTGPNAGWLGVNWWFAPLSNWITSFYKLSGNSAVLSGSGTSQYGLALWTTPLSQNQSSLVTVTPIVASDFVGPVVRSSIPTCNLQGNFSFYMAESESNNQIEIFEFNNNTWNLISNLGTYSGTINTLELDASGTSPVSLTVKVNGLTFGTASDSIYKLAGTYAGFNNAGSSSTGVTGWTGANL